MKNTKLKLRSSIYLIAALTVLVLISSAGSANADTTLTVTHGWDAKDDPGATGTVVYSVFKDARGGRPKLRIAYSLKGAKPLQKYDLAIGLFGLSGDGLKFFGVQRFLRNTFTREDVTSVLDGYIVGSFMTDRFGNGKSNVELSLAGVPSGSYNAQFTWTRLVDTRAYYRTGTKYGVGFGQIIVPK